MITKTKPLLATAVLCAILMVCGCAAQSGSNGSEGSMSGETVATSAESSAVAEKGPSLDEYLESAMPYVEQMEECLKASRSSSLSHSFRESHSLQTEAYRLYEKIAALQPPEGHPMVHEYHKEFAESAKLATQYYFKAVSQSQEGKTKEADESFRTASIEDGEAAEWLEKADAAIQ